MPMITCPDCKNQISDSAPSCPNCGKPNTGRKPNMANSPSDKKAVSILLGIGIFLLPFVFSWFTLRKGHSTLARIVSFVWLGFLIIPLVSNKTTPSNSKASPDVVVSQPKKVIKKVSEASYFQVNSEVGCDSKYSDNKKDDIFNSRYKDYWFTWRGVVVLAESDQASLNLDGVGTQDVQVNFANSNAGYDLVKDSVITVNFRMKTAGGCFLPFTGDEAVIVK